MIAFDWSKTDLKLGLWFAVVSLAVMNLAHFQDAAWMTAGLSALLAWLPMLLTDHRHFQSGGAAICIYFVVGCFLSAIGHWVLPFELGRIAAVGLVSVVAALTLFAGLFWYLVGYVLLFWYVLSPLFSASIGLGDTLEGHFVGCLGILLFWIGKRYVGRAIEWDAQWPALTSMPKRVVLSYAGIMSATTMIGIGVGGRILSADPTIMAQASLNIMVPSARQTWAAGISRIIFGIGGSLIGFYLGIFFPNVYFYEFLIAACSFAALALFKVNIALLVGAFAIMFTYPMGTLGDPSHSVGNEKIIAEFLGILVAGLAISLLALIHKEGRS